VSPSRFSRGSKANRAAVVARLKDPVIRMTSHLAANPPSLLAAALAALRATKHTTPEQLSHWSTRSEANGFEEIRAALKALISADINAPLPKGHPNTNAIKRELALEIERALPQTTGAFDPAVLQRAHRLASIDMSDRAAYTAYIGLVTLANADVLRRVRAATTANLVMHLSCAARVERAQSSCESFAAAHSRGVSQLIVVGSEEAQLYQFDDATRVLTVPAPDSYEQLPAKVIAAMFFFALCGHIDAVLKVDDDHRLRDVDQLVRAFARVVAKHPVQMGKRNNIGVLGNHLRVWHFGKCADQTLNPKPFTLPGTTRWINGASGYFLNASALRLLSWSHVYFPEYIRIGLYEDMTISDLLERQGARLARTDMSRILGTVHQY
jgi:hypothetical protein